MSKIAFLGIGLMGAGMAGRLLQAGHEVTVYNRSAEKATALVDAGAARAATPAEAACGAEVIFAMLADDGASEKVWLGEEGVLAGTPADGAICVECSTLSHDWVLELSEAVQSRGYTYVDCPVTGYPHMAADGTMTLFVGAAESDLAALRPLLEPLCKEIIHFGEIGAGTAYKLVVNLMGAVQIAGVAEGVLIAEKAGLNRDLVVEAISKGAAASPQVVRNASRMAENNHDQDITFTGKLRLKDTIYALELVDKLQVGAPFGHLAGDVFRRQVEDGLGDLSESKVIDTLAWLGRNQ